MPKLRALMAALEPERRQVVIKAATGYRPHCRPHFDHRTA
jgi:hypothetical protein